MSESGPAGERLRVLIERLADAIDDLEICAACGEDSLSSCPRGGQEAIRARNEARAFLALPASRPSQEETAWLIELGSNPPQWWTGRGDKEFTPYVDGKPSPRGNDANSAMRFTRRKDAERALGYLVAKGPDLGCKVTEHIWLASRPSPPQEQPPMSIEPVRLQVGWRFRDEFGQMWRLKPTGDESMPLIIELESR